MSLCLEFLPSSCIVIRQCVSKDTAVYLNEYLLCSIPLIFWRINLVWRLSKYTVASVVPMLTTLIIVNFCIYVQLHKFECVQEGVLKIHKQPTSCMCSTNIISIKINTCIFTGNFKLSTRTIVLQQSYNGNLMALNDIQQ